MYERVSSPMSTALQVIDREVFTRTEVSIPGSVHCMKSSHHMTMLTHGTIALAKCVTETMALAATHVLCRNVCSQPCYCLCN